MGQNGPLHLTGHVFKIPSPSCNVSGILEQRLVVLVHPVYRSNCVWACWHSQYVTTKSRNKIFVTVFNVGHRKYACYSGYNMHFACISNLFIFTRLSLTDASCRDAFQLNSTCYKVYKNERVPWLTAAHRCRSYNASLAVFSDDVRQYFPTSVLSEKAWIGLTKTRWHWPSAGHLKTQTFYHYSSYYAYSCYQTTDTFVILVTSPTSPSLQNQSPISFSHRTTLNMLQSNGNHCYWLWLCVVRCYTFDPSVVPIGAVGGRQWVGVYHVTCVGGGADNNSYYFYIGEHLQSILYTIQSTVFWRAQVVLFAASYIAAAIMFNAVSSLLSRVVYLRFLC